VGLERREISLQYCDLPYMEVSPPYKFIAQVLFEARCYPV
jgi:hypothetical protein